MYINFSFQRIEIVFFTLLNISIPRIALNKTVHLYDSHKCATNLSFCCKIWTLCKVGVTVGRYCRKRNSSFWGYSKASIQITRQFHAEFWSTTYRCSDYLRLWNFTVYFPNMSSVRQIYSFRYVFQNILYFYRDNYDDSSSVLWRYIFHCK